MYLYKYVAPERLDILENLRIRFTQPSAENDPFEFRPLVNRFRSPSKARETLERRWDLQFAEGLGQLDPATQEFLKKRPALERSLRERGLAKADYMSDTAAQDEIFKRLDAAVGILSLSEVPDSSLMWCRYAADHAGFVFEFEASHAWFHARALDNDDTHELRRVTYVDIPSSQYLSELNAHEVLYSKQKTWQCEREWRIIRPLAEGSSNIGGIYLFPVPPAALTGVIVGSRTTDESIERLARIVTANPQLMHLHVGCADCDPCSQTVEIRWAEIAA